MPSSRKRHEKLPPEEIAGVADTRGAGVGVGDTVDDEATDGVADASEVGVGVGCDDADWQAVRRRAAASAAATRLDNWMVACRTVTSLPSSLGTHWETG